MSQCCVSGFKWNGTPEGKVTKLGKNDVYVTGTNKEVAIMMGKSGAQAIRILQVEHHTSPRCIRMDAHQCSSIGRSLCERSRCNGISARFVGLYPNEIVRSLPHLTHHDACSFEGEIVTTETMDDPKKREAFDLMAFIGRNSKEKRFPEISEFAKALKTNQGFKKVGAIGFCYGGWAVFQLGAKGGLTCWKPSLLYLRIDYSSGKNLVDCISTAHPSLLTKEEINTVGVPVQIMAPEHDPAFTPELKAHANSVIPTLNVEYDYQYFPGLSHGFSIRGDPSDPKQKNGKERAKNAAVAWFAQILHLH